MIIDFKQMQLKKFDDLALRIMAMPEQYIQFDSVSDFYKATWLSDFPQGTQWCCSGLDDGAEQFDAVIYYGSHYLNIHVSDDVTVHFHIKQPSSKA